VTSIREVGGGGLYLRPRCDDSCAERLSPESATRATATVRERKEEQNDMPALYPLASTASEMGSAAGRSGIRCGRGNILI